MDKADTTMAGEAIPIDLRIGYDPVSQVRLMNLIRVLVSEGPKQFQVVIQVRGENQASFGPKTLEITSGGKLQRLRRLRAS